MSTQQPPKLVTEPPSPNPNRPKQLFWQIWFPLGLVTAGIITLMVLVALPQTFQGSNPPLADISVMWLSAPVMLGLAITVVILGGCVYLFAMLLKGLPPYLWTAQTYAAKAAKFIETWANKTVQPVITTSGWQASVRSVTKRFRKPSARTSQKTTET